MSLFRHSLLVGDDLHVPGYRVATDPGAIGAGMLWEDTDTGTLRKRNLTNTGWVIIGGAASIYFNVADYGALGDGSTDDTAAFKLAIAAAAATSYGGTIYVPPGQYILSGNPFIDVQAGLVTDGKYLKLILDGARLRTQRQWVTPANVIVEGTGRTGAGIVVISTGAEAFVPRVGIVTVTRASSIVTVVTGAAHRLEVGDTCILEAVDTSFNGGWQVESVPSTTSFTFTQAYDWHDPVTNTTGTAPHADTVVTPAAGTVTIPVVALGSTVPASHACSMRDLIVDCASLTYSVGIYSNLVNEPGHLYRVRVATAYRVGMWFEQSGSTSSRTGAMNYEIVNAEISLVRDVAAVGVRIRNYYGQTRGLDGITVGATPYIAATQGSIATGLDLSGCPGVYSRLHVEDAVNGILIGGRGAALGAVSINGASSMVVSGVTGAATNVTLVRLASYTEVSEVVLSGLAKIGGTNILVDESCDPDITLTASYLAFYATSGGVSPKRWTTNTSVSDSAGLIGDTRYQLVTITADPTSTGWANKFHYRADATAGSFTVTLPPVAGNAGRIVYINRTNSTGNVVTIDGNGAEVIGNSGALTYALRAPGAGLLLQCDGSLGWDILSEVFGGQVRGNISTVTADGVSWAGVYHRRADATAGAFSVTLPAAADSTNLIYIVSKSDSTANAVTVDGNAAETINGAATFALTAQYDAITLHCDGSGWTIIGVGV